MPEPISTATAGTGFVVGKVLSALAGLIGGLSVSVFWQPEKIKQHGKLAAGAIIGGISVGGSFTLGGMVAKYLGMDFADMDTALGIGFVVGVASVGLINFIANFFDHREKDDILEVAKEVNKARKRVPAKPKPRIARKAASK